MVAWNLTPQSTDDRQDQREHKDADQACDKNGSTCRRIQNDFAASYLFGWIWFLNHDVRPSNQTPRSFIVPTDL